jgi:integrase
MAGSISKRGKDTWRVRIAFGVDASGKRRTFIKTVHGSKKDAEKFLTAKLREKDLGTFVQPSSIDLDKYLNKWLDESARPRVTKNTLNNYTDILRIYVRPELGPRRLADIKLGDVQKLCNATSAAGLSASTVHNVHSVLSGAFKQAIEWHMLSVNPCSGVKLPKKEHTEMKAFTPTEARAFLKACEGRRNGVLFSFALVSGMRPEEYLGMKWADLDFANKTVSVQRALIRSKAKGGGWYFEKPKTKKSRRSISMPDDIFELLKTHRTAQLQHIMLLGSEYERNDLVFANEFGRPLDLKNLRTRTFVSILKAAGLGRFEKVDDKQIFIPGFRVYDLRHSMATVMLANGENPKVVSERLGHASIAITMDTYSHVLPDIQKDATDRLARTLFG